MNNLYLAHHGVLGMKWGVRRYQNKDGSLTEAGKKRYYGTSFDDVKKKQSDKMDIRSQKSEFKNTEYSGSRTVTAIKNKNGDDSHRKKFDDEFIDNAVNYWKERGMEINDDLNPNDFGDFAKAGIFDSVASEALSIYRETKDPVKAGKFLCDNANFKGLDFDFVINDEEVLRTGQKEVEKYLAYELNVSGKKYSYHTYGDEDYSDEQYFSKRNKR